VTLAPETTTPEMVRRLARRRDVAAGHTNAAYGTVRKALDAGLTGFTHLFNAMSPLTSREPGVVGAALESQDRLVRDHRRRPPRGSGVLRIALRTRPLDRFMLVTDAMPTVGMIDKSFDLQGRHIRVVDGVCVDDHGTLAGSDLDMIGAVRNAVSMLGLSLEDAVSIASAPPPPSWAWRASAARSRPARPPTWCCWTTTCRCAGPGSTASRAPVPSRRGRRGGLAGSRSKKKGAGFHQRPLVVSGRNAT
jgi:N-acetylglucosamine-6-phosphate deacetylase